MEFYKVIRREQQYLLEEEQGQTGASFDNKLLSRWAVLLADCYRQQEQLPLQFRKYLTAYYTSGEMEYVALAEADCLSAKPLLDGFASTWLEDEEENRVWIGADGAIENRGPSGEKVKFVLELLLQAFQENRLTITVQP